MTTRIDASGRVYEVADDATRTVTTYDETGTVTRPYTEAENAAADAVRADAATLTDLAARVARIEAHLWPAPEDPTTPNDPTVADWAALGGIWPNEGLLREGGIIWRKVSGVPLTTPPSGFPGQPGQWQHLFVAALGEPGVPDFVQPTGAHDAYKIGDRVRFNGKIYESVIAGNVWSPSAHAAGWKLAP